MRTTSTVAMSRVVIAVAVLIVGTACMPITSSAQSASSISSSTLAAGTRVRVSAPVLGKGKHIASVVSVSSDTLVLQLPGKPETIALRTGDMRSLDRSIGKRTRFWKGFLLGMTSGAALGAGIGTIVPVTEYPDRICYISADGKERRLCGPHQMRSEMQVYSMAVFGGIGEVVGGIVGLRTHSDRWQRVRQSDWATRVSIVPSPNRGLALAIAF